MIDYQRVFESTPGIILLLTPDLKIAGATQQRLEATMTRLEDIIGRDLFEVFPDNPDDPDATGVANLRASLERVLKTRTADTMAVQRYDIPRPQEQGGGFEQRYWSPVNAPVLAEDGSVQLIIHRVEDVTPLVMATERSEALHARTLRMEGDIVQRSKELQRAKDVLEVQAAELGRLNELTGRFLAMASHELRTPVTAIDGFATTMLDRWGTLSDEQKRQFVEIIEVQSRRLRHLTNDLLTLANLEAGKIAVDLVRVEVGPLLQAALRELDAQEEVAVRCPDDAVALADRDHLHQIVVNYLTNARKYGAAPVEVVVDERPEWVEICVADRGDGVPEEFVPRLFETFARATPQPGRDAEGTGLGLSIVRQLAHAQGGEAWYEPNSPSGAQFKARLPRG